jgi:hypothetical protein
LRAFGEIVAYLALAGVELGEMTAAAALGELFATGLTDAEVPSFVRGLCGSSSLASHPGFAET